MAEQLPALTLPKTTSLPLLPLPPILPPLLLPILRTLPINGDLPLGLPPDPRANQILSTHSATSISEYIKTRGRGKSRRRRKSYSGRESLEGSMEIRRPIRRGITSTETLIKKRLGNTLIQVNTLIDDDVVR